MFGGGLDYEVGGGLDLLGGVAHCHPEARPLDHVDVVGAVPDGDDFFSFYPERPCQVAEGRALAPVRMADFAEVIVGVHGGQGTVEVGIHHGRNVAYGPCVSGDNYLGRRRLDVSDEV